MSTASHPGPELAALDAFTGAAPEWVEHVAYPGPMAQPAATALRLLTAPGIAVEEARPRRIDDFLLAQRFGARAKPPSNLPTMGYGHDELPSDPGIAAYCRRYAIVPELSRLI